MTNGEKIKEIFPKLEWVFNAESEYYKTHIDGIHKHCFDSDWWHSEYIEPTTKNNLGVDCISRADAIRVASGYCHPSNVANELAKLPSVTQEPKTGHWIEVLGGCKCSCCDMAFSRLKETCADNFCPNCGADMREVKE